MRSNDESDTRASGGGEVTSRKPAGKERSFWRELPVLVILALGLALLIKTFLIQAFYIPSESMENTLIPGDRVLVNKLSYRLGDIQRGDVIVFNGADSWESEITVPEPTNAVQGLLRKVGELFGFSTAGEKDFIKRVVGLPGDHVQCRGPGHPVTVNGKPIAESGYLHPGDGASATPFDITVPAGRVWVMGDHRSASADSRSHLTDGSKGTIPLDHVLGRAFVVVWPLDRVTLLNRPTAYAKAGLADGVAGGAVPLAATAVALPLVGLGRRIRWQLPLRRAQAAAQTTTRTRTRAAPPRRRDR